MLKDIIGAFRNAGLVSLIFLALGFVRGHAKPQSVEIYRPSHNIPPAVQEKVDQLSLTELGRFTAILPPVGIAY